MLILLIPSPVRHLKPLNKLQVLVLVLWKPPKVIQWLLRFMLKDILFLFKPDLPMEADSIAAIDNRSEGSASFANQSYTRHAAPA